MIGFYAVVVVVVIRMLLNRIIQVVDRASVENVASAEKLVLLDQQDQRVVSELLEPTEQMDQTG
jgi:hypothetical protein